jgi:tetrahydromethanopterin S-methyltransferase subunit A
VEDKNSKIKGLLPYYSDTIHVANPESETCILCLWTKKDRVIEKVSENNYCFIGQLYSKDYGLQILFRNLLAAPWIRNLVIVGVDLNDSGEGLVNFFNKGVDCENRIIDTDVVLDDLLIKDELEIIRKRVKLHDQRSIKDFSKLNKYLTKIKIENVLSEELSKKIIVSLPKISPPIRFPTDFSGFKARGDDFYFAYRSLLSKVSRFGIFDVKKKYISVPNVVFFVNRFSTEDKKFLLSRKKSRTKIKFKEFSVESKKIKTIFFEELEVWDKLKDVCRQLCEYDSLCIIIGEAVIKESDLEDVVELLGNSPRYKWEPDPHGNLVIRVEDGLIKIIHFSPSGSVLEEFSASNAKDLFKKIASANKISMIYHALDIGSEIQKAEMALKQGLKYVQDKNL